MPEHLDDNQPEEAEDAPSKSAVKRQMHSLQQLGETLLEMNDKQLSQIPLEDERLLLAIRQARQIRSNSARKRHLQYIGKLMRDVDAQPIEKALRAMHQRRQQGNDTFHRLEQLRDEVLSAGVQGVELVTQCWPDADRQHLRQLVLQHQREIQKNKPPAASRKLFRYLRELQELYGDDNGCSA
jgi:ribosome-associated protein